jgi:hypothetical protein
MPSNRWGLPIHAARAMHKRGTEGTRGLESASSPRREQCRLYMLAPSIRLRILRATPSQSTSGDR